MTTCSANIALLGSFLRTTGWFHGCIHFIVQPFQYPMNFVNTSEKYLEKYAEIIIKINIFFLKMKISSGILFILLQNICSLHDKRLFCIN